MFVPEENLLGAEHGGFYLIMANFQWERLLMALGAVGAMQACFEHTLRFALERAPARRAGHPSPAGRDRRRDRGRARRDLRSAAPLRRRRRTPSAR